jgi:hypothetical protein
MKIYANSKERYKAWRRRNPTYMKQKRSTWYYKINAWKQKAAKRKIEFVLTDDYIKSLPFVCAYSGLPLRMEVGYNNSVSLDRIDSSRGYITGNVVFCTPWVNLMKQDKSTEEFVEMCNIIVNHFKNPS